MQQHLGRAYEALRAGELADAKRICAELLRQRGQDPRVLALLGMVEARRGDHRAALGHLRAARKLDPRNVDHVLNIGVLLQKEQQFAEAEEAYRSALQLAPRHPQGWNYLGTLRHAQGRLDDAVECYRAALASDPGSFQAGYNLAAALGARKDYAEQLRVLTALHERHPAHLDVRFQLARALARIRERDAAIAHFQAIVKHEPGHVAAWTELGVACLRAGRRDEAVSAYEGALACDTHAVAALVDLSGLALSLQRSTDARSLLDRAQALEADALDVLIARSNVAILTGEIVEAHEILSAILARQPDHRGSWASYLFNLHYLPDPSTDELFAAHRRWGERFAQGGASRAVAARRAGRACRVGYVSTDFRAHAVACFILPVLEEHDRRRFETFCYAAVRNPDAITDAIKAAAGHWRSIVGRDDEAVARLVEEDEIDILVDLNGHTTDNRLTVFALRPAPVQVTWLGYPNTTGLPQMDYRLTDAIADPEPEADVSCTERLVRLPETFLCYQPRAAPPITAPPVCSSGAVTFGSFNTRSKHNGAVIAVWSEILHRVPGSRLLLKYWTYEDEAVARAVRDRFAAHGIGIDRLELRGRTGTDADHLATYNLVDIALDPFPYNGTTTTCDALWMGVPVITLRGDRHAGRVSASLLASLGLDELVADDEAAYLRLACDLASDPARIRHYKSYLRSRFEASPLHDAEAFTRRLEAAYDRMLA